MDYIRNDAGGPQIRPVRDLRNNYAELAKLLQNHEPVFITNNGRGEAVLLNIEDYAAFEEYRLSRYIDAKLEEAERAAARQGAKRLSFGEVAGEMRERLDKQL